jgi:23S rRNA (cytosine1962-C5)-methyltransferase
MNYQFLDSGEGRKWEQFGPYVLERPAPVALWPRQTKITSDASFSRDRKWEGKIPEAWEVEWGAIRFHVAPTDFGHIGLFPEHRVVWDKVRSRLRAKMRVLNLFAYSGGVTLAAAQAGAVVCHLDAAKGMVAWAKRNADLNGLGQASIRWIVDDALKFVRRELKRRSYYDAIILDPPSFGRGSRGEVFQIEEDLIPLLQGCRAILAPQEASGFLVVSCHTPGWTPLVLEQLLTPLFTHACLSTELMQTAPSGVCLPAGSMAWVEV